MKEHVTRAEAARVLARPEHVVGALVDAGRIDETKGGSRPSARRTRETTAPTDTLRA